MRILVTGARLPIALALVRGLARVGATVLAADTTAFSMAGLSRHVVGYRRLPSPVFDFPAFKAAVLRMVRQDRIDRVIPVSEEVFYLAACQPEVDLFCPPLTLLRTLHSKIDFLEAARGLPVCCPRTERISTRTQGTLDVVKPEFVRGGMHDGAASTWARQERLAGDEVCTYGVAVGGQLRAHAAYRPLYRIGHGASDYFDPCHAPDAERFVEAFVQRYDLTGHIAFDFIRTTDGSLYVIDCNPRATSGLHLLQDAPDFASLFLGFQPARRIGPVGPARMMTSAVLMFNAWPERRRLGPFLANLGRARDAAFEWHDAAPLLGQLGHTVEVMMRARQWRMSAQAAFGYDIEWNGQPLP